MQLPFFYISDYSDGIKEIELDEDNSRHAVQVLRMKKDNQLYLADGKGHLITAAIIDDHKKHCRVNVLQVKYTAPSMPKISIAISLLKNTSRFEWFLEKATEIGISEIIPLLCARTEKQKFRSDRLQHILVSAMLQSQQTWLPVLHEPISFELLLRQEEVVGTAQKFIAHCDSSEKQSLRNTINADSLSKIILIGPEGDFTAEEISFAFHNHFTPVSLGATRLRSETAGVVAAVLLAGE